MNRVLIVAPSYAPSSNPPTHRVRFFARHLPASGWEPEVLTVDGRWYEEPPDAEIERLLPRGLRVTRVGALPARWTRPFGIGDLGMRGYFHLKRELRRICASRRPDAIFLPGPPWHTMLLGPAMRQEFGIPYVLDYIDPWVNALGADGRWWTKAYWFRRMAIALEPRTARGAAQIVAVSDGTNEGVRSSYPDIPAGRFTGIPYGFEASDFDALRAHPRPNPYWDPSDGNLHLVYVGAMLPNGYETLRAVLGAVRLLRERDPEFGRRLRLHFFGTTYDPKAERGLVAPVAGEMGLGDVVDERPRRIPYLDALNVLCASDGILGMGSTESHYTASKIFPCILARRPLLAVYHAASSVCDIVTEARAGALVTYDDRARAESRVEAVADALRRLHAPGGYDPASVRWDAFEQYSAASMTRRLAEVLDRAVAPELSLSPRARPALVGAE
jgi:hypothetical protein